MEIAFVAVESEYTHEGAGRRFGAAVVALHNEAI
jgi:hypothetical protein